MDSIYTILMENVKNSTASDDDWESLSEAYKHNLSLYFLMCCPHHLRPRYLKEQAGESPFVPTESLRGLPVSVVEYYAEDDDISIENGDINQIELSSVLVAPLYRKENEKQEGDIAAPLGILSHFHTIEQSLTTGVGNQPLADIDGNVESYVPTYLECTICHDDLSDFYGEDSTTPTEDLVRHYEICWKESARTPSNAPGARTAKYMGTKNLCTLVMAETKKIPSRIPQSTHCASCNKDIVEMNVVDAMVHKMNCFHAYAVQQEVWQCPICYNCIAGLGFDENDREYQRIRHIECCNGLRIRNKAMAEKHFRLYKMAQGVVQRIDWHTNEYRERYGKKPESKGDRTREIKDKFFLEQNRFPIGRSKLRDEILVSGEILTHAFGRSSQVEVLENLGLFQRSQFAVTHEELATQIVLAIDGDETQQKFKQNLLAAAKQNHAAIKQMQLDGEKRVVEAHRKWLAQLQEERRVTAVIKEEKEEQMAELLEVGQALSDFSDGDSNLSFIDPTDLECIQNQSGGDSDRSTSPERDSGSDSDEFTISGITTPDALYDGILVRPQAQLELIGDLSSNLATKVQDAIDSLAPSAAVVVATSLPVNPRCLPSAHQGDLPMNLLPTKAEIKKQQTADKMAQRKQYQLAYARFWAEEDSASKRQEAKDLQIEPAVDLARMQVNAEHICSEEMPPRINPGTGLFTSPYGDGTPLPAEHNVTDETQRCIGPLGTVVGIAATNAYAVNALWPAPLQFISKNVRTSTLTDRMRTRALELFSGDVN